VSVNLIIVHDQDQTSPPAPQGGGLYAWGESTYGELGLGSFIDSRDTPTRIGSDSDWTIAKANGASYAIRDGKLFAWGDAANYVLGTGNQTDVNTPTQIGSATDWDDVTWGMGLRNGEIYSWGYGYTTGQGTEDLIQTPTKIGSLSDWEQIAAAAGYASFGIRGGKLYSWGYNTFGASTGQGTTSGATISPTQIGSDSDWEMIIGDPNPAGRVLAIKNGALFHWGGGTSSPQQIGSDTGWTFASGNNNQLLAIRDGKLYAQGANTAGQLGLGYTSSLGTLIPLTQVGSATDWEWVASSGTVSFGIRGGKLFAWGANSFGQLGLGDTTDRTTPTQVGSDTDWQKVSTAGYSLAIKG
jgi:alpha-tubulin suppressor-like RCC1 family protein